MPQAGLSYPSGALVGGNRATGSEGTLQDYVFGSGIHKPEHSSILSYKYPQYYLTSLLDQLGASQGIEQDTWTWNTMDRTRKAGNISAVTLSTSATDTVTIDNITSAEGYFVEKDIVRTETGRLGRVTTLADNGGDLDVTLVALDGQNWTAAELAATKKIGHITTFFEEGSSAPTGRLYLPTEDYNHLGIVRRSFKITGSEFTNRTYLGDGRSWYFTQEDLEMKEMARDREGLIMFGERTDATSGNARWRMGRGLLNWVINQGIINNYASATGVKETDLQDHIRDLLIEGGSSEYTVLCGANFMADVQRALKDYAIDGAQSYDNKVAGLDFQAYKFMGKTINFAYYELFEDQEMLPTPGSASSTVYDFSNFSLWLDMGTDSTGQKLISLKHKEHMGQSRKYIHAYEVGMMNPNGQNGGNVANGDDAFQIHYLSEIGLEVRLPNRMGILAANS